MEKVYTVSDSYFGILAVLDSMEKAQWFILKHSMEYYLEFYVADDGYPSIDLISFSLIMEDNIFMVFLANVDGSQEPIYYSDYYIEEFKVQ